MKYKLIRVLDVAGLNVLEPVVRLFAGEEPFVQLKRIGLSIGVPILTFCTFLGVWSYVGPRHKTKSGEVPGPLAVLEAYRGIVQFHKREYTKLADYARTSDQRQRALALVEARAGEVAKSSAVANEEFKSLELRREETLEQNLNSYRLALEKQRQEYRAHQSDREAQLIAKAKQIAVNDVRAKSNYLKLIQQHLALKQADADHLKRMQSQIDHLRLEKWAPLEESRKRKNELEQEHQFLKKRALYLSSGNRGVKVDEAVGRIDDEKKVYMAATGADLLESGTKMIKATERLKKTANSDYAKPPTFFDQVWTSVTCVFAGFFIATVIAVPCGVLCGLSPVFMAALSPIISLLKPVSPIVWLPIVFIIVGGFITVPAEAWIPPAFLSSAITVALCSLWPTLANTALGVAAIDQDHLNVARVLRLGFWSRLTKIVIPSALPLIFAGLRISLGVGWMVLIAAELLSSSPGLGKFVWDMFNNGSSETFAQMFVVVFVVGVVGLLLDRTMIVLQRLVSFDAAPTAL